MPIVTCKTCGAQFHTRPGRITAGRGKYCSRECASAARRIAHDMECAWCGKTISRKHPRQKFCSRACAASAAHAAQFGKPRERKCAGCGTMFQPVRSDDRHCASAECRMRAAQERRCGAPNGNLPGLFEDPWASGAIPPDRYGKDLYRMPDAALGF